MTHLIDAPATFPTPWAARAFAIVSAIAEAGWFDLKEFQQALIESISAHELAGGCIGDEASYYDCWIEALTSVLCDRKGVAANRLAELESAIRDRLMALVHSHDCEHEDSRLPEPVFTEAAQ